MEIEIKKNNNIVLTYTSFFLFLKVKRIPWNNIQHQKEMSNPTKIRHGRMRIIKYLNVLNAY